MGRRSGLLDELMRDHLALTPTPVAEHAISNAGHFPRQETGGVRGVVSVLFIAFKNLKPPFFDAERLQQCLDGILVIALSRDVFTNEGGVIQTVC
jgi:hypothetical protein